MITYDELIELILLDTGQFVAGIDPTLLSKPQLLAMFKRELSFYSKYLPNKVTTSAYLYDGKVFNEQDDGVVPKSIVDIRTNNIFMVGLPLGTMPGPVHSYHWRYEKPVLYMRYPNGNYMFSYIADHLYDPNTDSFPTVDASDYFLRLCTGKFLLSVGRSRQAFMVRDIPLELNGADMISEGKEIYDNAKEELITNSRFNLAVLV